MEFRYDDPQWTPPEAWATSVTVFSFDGVEIVEQHDDPASPDTPQDALGQVSAFDFHERSGVFTLSAYTTYWAFRASTASIALRPANQR